MLILKKLHSLHASVALYVSLCTCIHVMPFTVYLLILIRLPWQRKLSEKILSMFSFRYIYISNGFGNCDILINNALFLLYFFEEVDSNKVDSGTTRWFKTQNI